MEQITQIVAKFTRQDPAALGPDTLINRKALQGSVLIHRMYAEMAAAGHPVENYHSINTYGELLARFNAPAPTQNMKVATLPATGIKGPGGPGVGIDIEPAGNLPHADDFREHTFYSGN